MLLNRNNSGKKSEHRFRAALHVAFGLLGRLLPDSEAMVKASSHSGEATSEELPEELRDPSAVFDRDRLNVL